MIHFKEAMNNFRVWGWRDSSGGKNIDVLAGDPGLIPSINMAIQNCL